MFLAGMWTAFMLKFHSNQLILCDVHCWEGKEATPVGLAFVMLHGSVEGRRAVFLMSLLIVAFRHSNILCHI
jgi:hypothetical protein